MSHQKDIVPGIALGVLSIIYFILSFQIEAFRGAGATPIDSSMMPKFWAIVLFSLSVNLVRRGFKKKVLQTNQRKKRQSIKERIMNNHEIALTFVALTIYIAGLKTVGFLIMSFIYLIVQIAVLTPRDKRNFKEIILVSTVSSVLISYMFVNWLNVLLPRGLLGF